MLKRLRMKFVAIHMAVVTIMLLIIFGLLMYFTKEQVTEETVRMMQSVLNDPFQVEESADNLSYESSYLSCFLIYLNSNGLRVINYGYSNLPEQDTLLTLTDYAMDAAETTGKVPGYNLRYYRSDSLKAGCVVFADTSHETQSLRQTFLFCLIVGGISLAVFAAAGYFLARWAVRPVGTAWQEQRQFISDASHELKTPLAVIMTNAELIQASSCEDSSHAQSAENILTVSRQMRSLVESMLELARTENGLTAEAMKPLDFSSLVSEELLLFEPLFFENSRTLTSQIEEGITLSGSDSHLRQALDILLDNAQKYSLPDTETVVTLTKQGHSALLSVATQGNPLSAQDCKNIFKRFYRADPSRRRDGSYGLGLPIARRITENHHGKIWAKSEGTTNTFFLQLPLGHGGKHS